jgi:hypothetical protein
VKKEMRKKRRGRRGVKEEGVGNQVVYAVAVQCAEQHKSGRSYLM